MKKRLLSNRVRNAILMAILLQSVIFGIGLMVTGTFSGTANRPYKVMESQVAEKDALISGYMNNSLLIANTMEKELAKIKDDRKIHDRLIDNLNHASSVDGVFYLDLDKKEAVIYRDGEPQIFSSAYGDIYCVVGSSKSEYPIALSKDWSPKLTPDEWAKAELFWTDRTKGGKWFFDDNRLYYVISQEVYGSRRMMGFQISGEVLDSYLSLDNPPYKGMEVLLMTDETILYSRDKAFIGTDYDYRGDGSRISLTYNGASYDGVRSVLQVYGHMEGGSVYVGAVCYHSELAELSRSTIVMVAGVYLLSIVIAIIFSYIAIWMVLKPIKKLHEDITCQNPEEVHFRESGIEEIDRIHQALNDMAAKLEQSYSRYSFTLESAGEKVGSFEYQEGGSRVKLSSSILQLLDIGADRMGTDGCLDYDVWEDILGGLDRVMELEDGFSYTDRMCNTRAVSIRQRHEEHGVFGIVMDKTDAYMEILRLRNISQHDQLTGLYNASYLKKEGQKILDGNMIAFKIFFQYVFILIRNIPGTVNLVGKFLQYHRQLPELGYDRVPALQETVLPGQVHGSPSQAPVQLGKIILLFPAPALKHLRHVLKINMALLLKCPQKIIEVIAVLLLAVRIQITPAAVVAHQGSAGLHGGQSIILCQLSVFFYTVVKRSGQLV